MASDDSGVGYVIWGADHAAYGPVELPALVTCIREERVNFDSWIFLERSGCWEKAGHIPELQMFFHGGGPAPSNGASNETTSGSSSGLPDPASLRHIKILAGLNNDQLQAFLQATEVQSVLAGTRLAKQGEPANAMYLLLEGGLRVRGTVDGRDTNFGTLNAGDFFGEVSLEIPTPITLQLAAGA